MSNGFLTLQKARYPTAVFHAREIGFTGRCPGRPKTFALRLFAGAKRIIIQLWYTQKTAGMGPCTTAFFGRGGEFHATCREGQLKF